MGGNKAGGGGRKELFMLMAQAGTGTKRDELALNTSRLEIRGSSVLEAIPPSSGSQREPSEAGSRARRTNNC